MIRKSEEYKVENIKGLKDGKGEVTVINFFQPEDFNGKGRLYGKSIIKPGSSIGYHKHVGDQEAYYILKGKALYNINGKDVTLEPGDLAICKDGDSHSIESIGNEDLEYIMLILYV
ncbi:cupin domain-containing protein [Maledivibacter halophilus]|uniref:Cupin domain protein n=1 Tax=Maledivibacter halophilus TaxID=36842 RepID=A0A1T5MXL7_9FIRM|nr:cupin domain-containing protein [Maledivibacter halophilus]SKC92598.1 Cupin domain protein [Maledivibacter halophilus]